MGVASNSRVSLTELLSRIPGALSAAWPDGERYALDGRTSTLSAGDAVFVPAGAVHRFEGFSADFAARVTFWGPDGGESAAEPGSP